MSYTTNYILTCPADVLCLKGADRVDLLHRLSTQDLRPLREAGRTCQTLFTTQQGKLVDWTRLYALDDRLWLLTSAGRADEVRAWIDKYTIMEDVVTQALPGALCEVMFVGPDAVHIAGLPHVPMDGVFIMKDEGVWNTGLAAFGGSIQALVPEALRSGIEEAAVEAGAEVADGDRAAWLRLLAGVPSAAFEYREQVNPLELRLTKHAVGWNKGCYIGQEVISRLDSYDKVARLLIGFESDSKLADLLPGDTYKVYAEGRAIGRVTSWVNHEDAAVGLAVVKREAARPGAAALKSSETAAEAAVRLVQRPFFG